MPSVVLRRSLLKPRGPFIVNPEGLRLEAAADPAAAFELEAVPRNCRLEQYERIPVPEFTVDQEIIAYCSPDSTYAVTKRLFEAATKSILIGIYDFSASYIRDLVLDALRRKVKVRLMLDIDSDSEQRMFDRLVDSGVDGVPAPSCASQRARFFASSHEKVIVIDGEWSLVQSGNYSKNSVPFNVKDGGDPKRFRFGNRDMGLAIRSRKLSKFFTEILESDMALELNGPESLAAVPQPEAAFLVEKAPTIVPSKLFPSKTFRLTKPLKVQPVLSPDNYMSTIPAKLRAARKSILIEQQYIRGKQTDIEKLLDAVAKAREQAPNLDVRIVLGKLFKKSDLPKEQANLKLLKSKYKLALGKNVRFVDTTRFVHCHNKMVLIDDERVLISSQNWSNSAVSKNREAGVWLEHKGIYDYFREIFESDWKVAKNKPTGLGPDSIEPEALQRGGYVEVAAADYQEV